MQNSESDDSSDGDYEEVDTENSGCDSSAYSLIEDNSSRWIHMSSSDVLKKFPCGLCSYATDCRSHWKSHKQTHAQQRSFMENENMTATASRVLQCSLCSYVTCSSSNFKRHQLTHSQARPYVCAICHHAFNHKYRAFRCHFENADPVLKRLRCALCPFITAHVSKLNRHKLTHYREKKTYSCPDCQKTFTQKYNLKVHMRLHTGHFLMARANVSSFYCKHCFYRSGSYSDIKTHEKVHTKDRIYSCDVCHRTFNRKYNLKAHMRIHSGEKPFSCKFCTLHFSFHTSLKNHVISHHSSHITK
ncbi:zinc finger protein 14-like [Stegodyphus dumicola]|uniref:zinc finger protein 14-like n=1 Tax=Stegodyphus dumicola TaxID=202533 RepID=UPI0015AF7468|nr:zinc finger protein 14-like [Stegodyphus dumicola]